ncbi:MAG TPA: hypothetical protein VMX74_09470 [Pirellulales bacterium]|nr:hypothetical protein [Pirellulales bacterium]
MPVRTNIAKGFLFRLAAVAFVGIGFALWALYDGAIGYPYQQKRGEKYHELMGEDEEMSEEELAKWDVVATENGWQLDDPGPPKTKFDIAGQFVMVGLAAPFGILFLYFFVRNYGRWIEATEQGLHTSWKQEFRYDQIETLNKRHWKKKGIAKITYSDNGRKRQFVLDDFKYDFDATKKILIAVEAQLDMDQFVDGLPQELPSGDVPAEESVADAAAEETGSVSGD